MEREAPGPLIFQARFDDGFALYLNGSRVLNVNFAPDAEPTFASIATLNTEARSPRRFDLTPFAASLHQGENVVAIALLNRSATNDDLSLIPELGTVSPVLHASFRLDTEGESVVLARPDGQVADEVALPPQYEDQSYGRLPDGTGSFAYLLHPTMRGPNEGPSSPTPLVIADTKFSADRGFFDAPIDVELSSATAGAEIRYTTDGSPPAETSGTVYTGPIHVAATTVLRAAAFKPGYKPTNVDTHTYFFLDDVVRQDVASTIAAGFPQLWASTPADYGMDPDVIGQNGTDKYGGKYTATVRDDLKSVATLSIAMTVDDLFGPSGIYSHTDGRGVLWERPASAELIEPDGSKGFHVNAGIRIQGGAFRSHGLTKKHSFRLVFKSLYGPTKLNFRFFPEPGAADSFDTLTLRANSNDGWQWDSAGAKPLYIRDSFGREASLAMGAAASHERHLHVYLNGVYWGLYNLVERPDAAFSATYFGGDKDEWDALSNDQVSHGDAVAWNALLAQSRKGLATPAAYQAVQGNRPDGSDDPLLENYLDVRNLADYMITNLYVGNTDWPHKNWWSARRRVDSTGFKFYMWDSEWSLGLQSDVNANQTGVSAGVSLPYAAVRTNPEFRVLFGDRVHAAFFNGGPLYVDPTNPTWDPQHPERNVPAALFARLAAIVERAIVPESARWGDQHVAKPYTRDEHWRVERDNLLRSYFPVRSANVLQQFRAARLYPAIDAPVFHQHGGLVPPGFRLSVRTARGTVLLTTDGSDPRLPGGATSPTAHAFEAAQPLRLVAAGASARYLVPADDSLELRWTAADFDDASWDEGPTGIGFEGATGLEGEIRTDVGSRMLGVSASIYTRFAFDAPAGAQPRFFTLRMKFDDGYVAYLNGVRVASRNAPEAPAAGSTASRAHTDAQAVVFEEIDLSPHLDALRAGRNVLAIHGLNVRAADNDFLLLPELEAAGSAEEGLSIEDTTLVRARALDGAEWSALNEATFVVDGALPLRITELMYHPAPPSEGSSHDAEDFEFIELQNVGSKPATLAGVRLTQGVEFDFNGSSIPVLGPGELLVLVRDREAFAARYPDAASRVAGVYDGKLANDEDTLLLQGPRGETLLELRYVDDWYPSTDGAGRSLVAIDPRGPPEAWKDATGWRESLAEGGSPGVAEDGQPSGGWQLAGDWNQDGHRNVSDPIRLLARLFGGFTGALPCDGSLESGGNLVLHDSTGDGKVDLADAVHLLTYLFRAGDPPFVGAECLRVEGCPSVCAPR